jgi:outer membrane protein assembly factor BamB
MMIRQTGRLGIGVCASLLLVIIPSIAGERAGKVDFGQPGFYGQAPWASVHRDSRNSDFSPLVTSTKLVKSWSVLDGAALINPGVIGADGTRFVTSARGPGYSHLHAFSADGELLWQSPVQKSETDLDAMAGFNAPVIGPGGDLYIGDGNQFWAFHADGSVKWVVPLPERDKPFVYQIISAQGFVGGITVAGKVLFYQLDDGRLAIPAFQLPPGVSAARGPSLPGLWQGGLMHETVIELFKQIAFGYGVQVANAPAVHPVTGRVFITAAGPMQGEAHSGVLYGLDVKPTGIEIGFATPMGGGSGTSPALSADGSFVYSADGEGQMLSVDTRTGKVVWAARGEGLLSPAIADDGTILTGDIFAAPTVVALNPGDGARKWAKSYDDYAASRLPVLEPHPPEFPSGQPVARLVSVISASANAVWVGMNLGYDYHQPGSGLTLPVPHITVVCALRPQDGTLLDCVDVRDTVEGMINIGTAGRLSVSHTSIFGSFFYHGLNPLLPQRYRSPMVPVGGLTALEPESFCEQAVLELGQVDQFLSELDGALAAGDQAGALHLATRASIQAGVIEDSLLEMERAGDLPAAQGRKLRGPIEARALEISKMRGELAADSPAMADIRRRYRSLFDERLDSPVCP